MITFDVMALCAAIDAGDDTACLALADVLEEMGRQRPTEGKHPRRGGSSVWVWSVVLFTHHDQYAHCLPREVFDRLAGGELYVFGADLSRSYPARSAAFLALAEAMYRGDQ